VVESIDHFDGFALVNMAIRRAIEGRKDRLMPIICILTFFLSSIIDNLTSTIVAVKILRRLAPENQEYRQLCGGLAVIAANAGGAWSPIGDVTTTMLWISDRISATKTVLWLFFPSLVAGVLPLWFLRCRARRLDSQTHKESQRHKAKDKKGPNWEQEPLKEDIDAEEKEPITRKKITALIFGVFCILMVPGLKMGCGLPPYLGMLLALGLMWLLTDVLQMQGAHEEEVDSEGIDSSTKQLINMLHQAEIEIKDKEKALEIKDKEKEKALLKKDLAQLEKDIHYPELKRTGFLCGGKQPLGAAVAVALCELQAKKALDMNITYVDGKFKEGALLSAGLVLPIV
ncbi:unnamed protein product, partial [Cladocopium goreaui]